MAKVPLNSIRRSVLQSALACGLSALPNEFGGMLRSDEPGVITELVLIPGTTTGRRRANLQLWMLPADFTIIGTVHSHPSGALHPSDADLQLFHHWGIRHLILGNPYARGCWRAYNGRGEEVHLDVLEDASEEEDPPSLSTYEPPRPVHTGARGRRRTGQDPTPDDDP